MTQPEGLTSLTDPDNDMQMHFVKDGDGGGMSPAEARRFLAQIIPPVRSSEQQDTEETSNNG